MTIDANAQSGILLTPIEKFQNVDSGAEAGFQLEVETLASAPPSDASGCVGQNGLGLVDLVHGRVGRSEEHTSELQSLMRSSYDVFCLKKNNINKTEVHI